MTVNHQNRSEIVVYSWASLWIYWPMYLAFALTEKTLNVKFRLVTPTAPINDQTIRAALASALKADQFVPAMALCEPGPIGDWKDQHFSRIPLIWRQPHWLITRRREIRPKTLWCYPASTTSGDYARALIGAVLIEPSATPELTNQDLGFLGSEDPETVGALTFTPSHLFGPDLYARPFSGPDRDVTALIIPNVSPPGNELRESLRDTIRGHLHQVLQGFGTTHGDDQRVKELIQTFQPQVEGFYGAKEYPYSGELATALAEYIRQGCFFPYRVVASALTGELRRITDEVLTGAKEDACRWSSEKLSELLAPGYDWSVLSFPQRQSVWSSGADNGDRLHVRIAHAVEPQSILTGASVRLSPSDLPITASSLNFVNRPLLCRLAQDKLCLVQTWETKESVLDDPDPCFACSLGGLVMPISRSAASKIAMRHGKPVSYGSCSSFSESTPQSVVCWEDVKGLVALFCREFRTDQNGRCRVILCKHANDIVSFSILWNGDITGKGNGGATRDIPKWAESHTTAHRTVVSAGFWRNSKYEPLYGSQDLQACKCHTPWLFGYVAFFNEQPTEPAARAGRMEAMRSQ